MFIDKVKIKIKSGKGGSGAVKFSKLHKPNGGDGGNGGGIYLEGDENLSEYSKIFKNNIFISKDGANGGFERMKGKNGEDLIIKLPLITKVKDLKTGNLIYEIKKHKQRELILEGGLGGLGNWHFRRGQESTLKKHSPGKEGKSMELILELNLFADIVFIGFPNAGKSSMLNFLTNAKSKVASYPFTTLNPHLGITNYNIILMDLPGLIEGTNEGKGLGTRFTKHTNYAKAIAHFVSIENEDIVGTYKKMRKELNDIDPNLASKIEIVLLTKIDLFDQEYIEKKLRELKKMNLNTIPVSVYDSKTIEILNNSFRKLI